MDPFGSSAPSSGASSGPSADAMMEQIKTQLAQAYAKEFLEDMIEEATPPIMTDRGKQVFYKVHNKTRYKHKRE
ncbi:Mitochondrial import inner membrane translocase subunit [Musa troglodytarum]|uniref:Mitochondrial import inner membrane translocase subunit n=1 Tax=Musa troglodytarum TaxID=320322 RepID=A0A9E7JU39_9LILI|nr:Mitochondrial import inner membrane translocase subunit [Musa troglodytarum]